MEPHELLTGLLALLPGDELFERLAADPHLPPVAKRDPARRPRSPDGSPPSRAPLVHDRALGQPLADHVARVHDAQDELRALLAGVGDALRPGGEQPAGLTPAQLASVPWQRMFALINASERLVGGWDAEHAGDGRTAARFPLAEAMTQLRTALETARARAAAPPPP